MFLPKKSNTSFYLILILVIFLAVNGCGGEDEPKIDFGEAELFLTAKDGSLQPVKVAGKTGVFVIASWCNFSHQFIDTLNDPKISKYLKDATLVFVFKDEIFLDNDVAEVIKNGGKGLLYDEDMLAKLPGEYFFITDESQEKNNLQAQAYPRWFHPVNNRFEKNVLVWFRDILSIPENEFYEVYQAHAQPHIDRF